MKLLNNMLLNDDSVPIREISRVTGVNTVTLRAWERRYGLLVPQRTLKGHRLYSRADIARVKEIQLWLGRGLAISKVKALLSNLEADFVATHIDSNWLQLVQKMQVAINNFQRNQLESLFDDTLALYPSEMIADYLLLPLLHELQGDQPGMRARRAFFTQVMLELISSRQSRQRQSARAQKILVLLASPDEPSILAQLLTYGLLVKQYQVEFVGYLDPGELQVCYQALAPKLVVIIGHQTLNTSELQLHLSCWQEESHIPLILLGDVARAYQALGFTGLKNVQSCETQQQIFTTINQLLNG